MLLRVGDSVIQFSDELKNLIKLNRSLEIPKFDYKGKVYYHVTNNECAIPYFVPCGFYKRYTVEQVPNTNIYTFSLVEYFVDVVSGRYKSTNGGIQNIRVGSNRASGKSAQGIFYDQYINTMYYSSNESYAKALKAKQLDFIKSKTRGINHNEKVIDTGNKRRRY